MAEPRLTYEKAVELSLSMELAAQNVKDLKIKQEGTVTPQSRQQVIHKLTSPRPHVRKTTATCFRCGNTGHIASKCRFSRNIVCHQCGQSGHMQKAC